MATAIQKNVEAASEKYSSSFTKGSLALPPAKKYLVLTCMDARIDPAEAFGIELGDAHVIRNVGDEVSYICGLCACGVMGRGMLGSAADGSPLRPCAESQN